MPQDRSNQSDPNTPNRDRDYGAAGNLVYEQMKFDTSARLDIPGMESERYGQELVEQIIHPKLFFIIPVPESINRANSVSRQAALEAVEDAFLSHGLPSPVERYRNNGR